MPIGDGFMVMAMMHSGERPEPASIPIIVLKALAMKGDRETNPAADASDDLAKPVTLTELERAIRTILERPVRARGQRLG
jgi:CheY-like chemotaxis protein